MDACFSCPPLSGRKGGGGGGSGPPQKGGAHCRRRRLTELLFPLTPWSQGGPSSNRGSGLPFALCLSISTKWTKVVTMQTGLFCLSIKCWPRGSCSWNSLTCFSIQQTQYMAIKLSVFLQPSPNSFASWIYCTCPQGRKTSRYCPWRYTSFSNVTDI